MKRNWVIYQYERETECICGDSMFIWFTDRFGLFFGYAYLNFSIN